MMLTPVLAVTGYTQDTPYVAIEPEAIDSDVGVVAGDTLKWDIDALDLPSDPDNVTLPDFAGNQIYMKILHVDDSYTLPEGTGTYVTFAVGLLFLQTETITIYPGLPVLEQNIVIPAGAATPSMTLAAALQRMPTVTLLPVTVSSSPAASMRSVDKIGIVPFPPVGITLPALLIKVFKSCRAITNFMVSAAPFLH